MRKKGLVVIALFLCLLLVSACGKKEEASQPKEPDYKQMIKNSIRYGKKNGLIENSDNGFSDCTVNYRKSENRYYISIDDIWVFRYKDKDHIEDTQDKEYIQDHKDSMKEVYAVSNVKE